MLPHVTFCQFRMRWDLKVLELRFAFFSSGVSVVEQRSFCTSVVKYRHSTSEVSFIRGIEKVSLAERVSLRREVRLFRIFTYMLTFQASDQPSF